MLLQNLKSPEIEKLDKKRILVLIPLGSIEAHGPHLPIGNDSIIVEHFARKVGEKLENVIVTPTIYYAHNLINYDYPGTLNITPEHYAHYLQDILKSFYHHGFENFLLFSSHGANDMPVKLAITNLLQEYCHSNSVYCRDCHEAAKAASPAFTKVSAGRRNDGLKIAVKTWWDLAKVRSRHAERLETELMMEIAPELIDLEKAVDCKPKNPWHYFPSRKKYHADTYGVNGEPTKANKKDAKVLYERIVDELTAYIEKIIGEL